MSNTESLLDKYRPATLEEVVGQRPACAALARALDAGSHAFLLSGPSGVGKTTLARIGAATLGAERMEIDAATHTGIDAMREVQDILAYKPLAADRRAVIVDEAHRLSAQTWDSLLKIVEEPPSYVYWFFCTTAPAKLPDTVRSRCVDLKLKAIGYDDLMHLLATIDRAESMETPFEVVGLCAREAAGSARKAVSHLSMVRGLNHAEARELLHEKAAPQPVAALCKLLMDGGTWLQAMPIVASLNDDPESTRIMISNYIAAVLKNAKTDKQATFLLNILEQFSQPYHQGEKQAPLMLSIGRVLFG